VTRGTGVVGSAEEKASGSGVSAAGTSASAGEPEASLITTQTPARAAKILLPSATTEVRRKAAVAILVAGQG